MTLEQLQAIKSVLAGTHGNTTFNAQSIMLLQVFENCIDAAIAVTKGDETEDSELDYDNLVSWIYAYLHDEGVNPTDVIEGGADQLDLTEYLNYDQRDELIETLAMHMDVEAIGLDIGVNAINVSADEVLTIEQLIKEIKHYEDYYDEGGEEQEEDDDRDEEDREVEENTFTNHTYMHMRKVLAEHCKAAGVDFFRNDFDDDLKKKADSENDLKRQIEPDWLKLRLAATIRTVVKDRGSRISAVLTMNKYVDFKFNDTDPFSTFALVNKLCSTLEGKY